MAIKFDQTKISIVSVDKVRPNSWNPKDKDTDEFRKIKRGIELKGQRLPVIVRENNGYEIVDGEQRYTAIKELGWKEVLIYNEGKITDQEAKELTIWYQQQVPFNEVELATLVVDMARMDNIELPYLDTDIEDFKKLLNFDWNKEEQEAEAKYEEGVKTLLIKMTEGQYQIVTEALGKVKMATVDCPDGRALELICADYLAGAEKEE